MKIRNIIKSDIKLHASLIVGGACMLLLVTSIITGEMLAQNKTIRPIIPTLDRHQPGKVFLEHADSLVMEEAVSKDYLTLYGNVKFRKGDMFMYCDSAHFYERSNSLNAYGHVKMEQGDTLFVYGNELNYNGMTEHAVLYSSPSSKVQLINRDVKLETDVFHYDMRQNLGYYDTGGVLTDKLNRLTSVEGEYYPNTKDAFFYYDVMLTSRRPNDTLKLVTDSLTYNTNSHIARIISRTTITNKDGRILTSSGTYNTVNGVADLYARSTVITNKGNILKGDTLMYDRQRGIGQAFGNMELIDTVNKANLYGDYGYYNENRDSAFVTGNALAIEYSRQDSLYVHGDTINAYRDWSDTTRVTNAFHRVRFYRTDIQGLCDSLSLTERDSILYLYRHPIVWSGERQIYGNIINVHLNDSTADWARLPEFGIMSEHVAEDCYNQLCGNDMTAWFADTTITRLYVEGNVQVVMFPMENDSTYNKFAYAESSYLDANFDANEIKHVVMWPETSGRVTPLYLAKKSSYFLPKFKWYADMLRPVDPWDVFSYPPAMEELFSSPQPGRRRASSKPVTGPLKPTTPADYKPVEGTAPNEETAQPTEN